MLNLTSEKKEQVKILIDSAEELFATYGYDGTSLRMITVKAKMNQAAVSYYFRSKEGLYSEVLKSRLQILNNILSATAAEELDEITKLGVYIETYIENVVKNKNFHKILCREIYLLSHDFAKKKLVASSMYSHFELLRKILETGISKGVFKKVDVDIFSLSFFTLVTPLVVKTPLVEQIFVEQIMLNETSELINKIKIHFLSILQKQV